MENILSVDFPMAVAILLGVAVVAALYALFIPLIPLRRVGAKRGGADSEEEADSGIHTSVSVIAYDSSPDNDLAPYIEALMRQDYPDFEVIVVTESTREGTEALTNRYADLKDRLYFTFLPPGSHNLSRRKMAYTIGIKAARGDVVLTTVTNAFPDSERWLSEMMRPFNNNSSIGISLGYSRLDFKEMKGIRKWYRQFDSVMTDSLWIGRALAGNPYRGDGNNLAFYRSLFFDHKGYAASSFLQYGDDTLFINQLTKSTEAEMVMSPGSFITMKWGNLANQIWAERKDRYAFDSRWLPKGPSMLSASLSWSQWLSFGCCVAAAIMGLPSLVPAIISVAALSILWCCESITYRRAASVLGAKRLWWSVPMFILIRPVYNILFKEVHKELKLHNYTWQRPVRHFGQ